MTRRQKYDAWRLARCREFLNMTRFRVTCTTKICWEFPTFIGLSTHHRIPHSPPLHTLTTTHGCHPPHITQPTTFSNHLTSWDLSRPYVTFCDLMKPHMTSVDLTALLMWPKPHVTPCYLSQPHVTSPQALADLIWTNVTLCNIMWEDVTACNLMWP